MALELNDAGILRRGKKWTMAQIITMLRRWVYAGKVEYKGEVYDGEHEAIIDDELWNLVRQYMAGKPPQRSKARGVDGIAPLKGILRCGHCGGAMTPSYTYKGGKRYCFYVCVKDSKRSIHECPIRRLSAGDIESYVIDQLAKLLRSPEVIAATCGMTGLTTRQEAEALGETPTKWMTQGERQRLAELLLESVTVYDNEVVMEIKSAGMQTLAKEAYNEDQD